MRLRLRCLRCGRTLRIPLGAPIHFHHCARKRRPIIDPDRGRPVVQFGDREEP